MYSRSTQSHFEDQLRSTALISTGISTLQITQPVPIIETSLDEKDACIRSFYLSDYRTKLYEVAKRAPGTCEWVLAHENFQAWSESKSPTLLWLSGHPGCGKTVISSFLIESLRARPDSSVIYFICDNKHEHFRTKECILRSLLHQLIIAHPELLKYALPHFKTMKEAMATSAATLWTMFQDYIMDESFPTVYCILDALDECEDDSRQWLLERLSKIFPSDTERTAAAITMGPLKILVTSRPWEDIEYGFQAASRIRLKTEEEESINSDIHVFVKKKVRVLAERRRYTEQQRGFVTETLIDKANGMFLWVSLVIADLEKTPPSQIKQRLNELPKTLFGLYQGILEKVDEFAIARVKHILQWVTTAFRPLSLKELALACEIQELDGLRQVNMDDIVQCIKGDIGLCGPILTIRNEHVNLVHQSAKDFFLTEHRSFERSSTYVDYHINLTKSHADLTALCLKYLTFDEFDIKPLSFRDFYGENSKLAYKQLERFSFLEYSAKYWPDHYRKSCTSIESLTKAIQKFFYLPQNSAFWLQTSFFLSKKIMPRPGGTPIHFAVYLGIPSIVRRLLEEGMDVNIGDDGGQNPLHWFIEWPLSREWSRDKKTLLETLIEARVDVNSKDEYDYTPLYLATIRKEKQVVEALIGAGAEVNLQNYWGQTPLHSSAGKWGDRDIVKLLVKKGADINAVGENGYTVLMEAARRGHQEVVEFLVEKGADVNAIDSHGRTALIEAAVYGTQEMVGFLVEKGANVNATGRDGWTALMEVAPYGNYKMGKFLVEKGANINAIATHGNTALAAAARSGNQAMVRFLVQKGADINMVDEAGKTALDWAKEYWRTLVVQFLEALEDTLKPGKTTNSTSTPEDAQNEAQIA